MSRDIVQSENGRNGMRFHSVDSVDEMDLLRLVEGERRSDEI
uniref:Uncharacterized protein n=1 Tax=Anguilla anguilla TaxID=7936 RepID=A0A0E9RYX4_ANGAN